MSVNPPLYGPPLYRYIPGVGKIPACIPCTPINATYATFISKTNQAATGTSSPIAITYDSRENGAISPVASYPTSGILIPATGTYKVVFSAQVDTISGSHYLEIWPVINATSVPNSNTRIRIQNQAETCLTIEYILECNANDVLRFYMVGEVGARIVSLTGNTGTTPTVPDVPSMIVTIIRLT